MLPLFTVRILVGLLSLSIEKWCDIDIGIKVSDPSLLVAESAHKEDVDGRTDGSTCCTLHE